MDLITINNHFAILASVILFRVDAHYTRDLLWAGEVLDARFDNISTLVVTVCNCHLMTCFTAQ